jgi:hypothetical protein
LLRTSTGCTPSALKCVCSCGWTTSQIGCCGISNSNCLLKPFCDYFWHLSKIIHLDFLLINRLLMKMSKFNMWIQRNLWLLLVKKKKSMYTKNSLENS